MVKAKKLNKAEATPATPAAAAPATPGSAGAGTASKKIRKRSKGKKIASDSTPTAAAAGETKAVVPAATPVVKAKLVVSATPQQKPKGNDSSERSSGFIFFCSAETKLQCFQYRVFALPKGRSELVGRIKPGARLFLYDFQSRLLYGIYRATSSGGLNLVPEAFGGRYPAQVKFKIEKDCVPLPEKEFRHAIEENYDAKNRFQPDLNSRQVHKLCTMFQPVSVQTQIAPPQIGDGFHAPSSGHFPPSNDLYKPGRPARALPSADAHYGATLVPAAPRDSFAPAPHYPHRPPVLERHAPAAHPEDPYYPAPQTAPYHQADIQSYYSEPRQAGYLMGRDAVPPGRDYPPSREYPPAREYPPSREYPPAREYPPSREYPPAREYPPSREYPPARDNYTVTGELAQRSERLDMPYYVDRPVANAPSDLLSQQGYVAGYNDPTRYGEGTRTLSGRANTNSVPVSSLYSFAGAAPAYR